MSDRTATETLTETIAELGLSITSTFVPFSRSRNAPRKGDTPADIWRRRGLNWKVALVHKGREIYVCDYGAGMAHCPSYKQGARLTVDYVSDIEQETEHGRRAQAYPGVKGAYLQPDPLDVVSCLVSDASAIDYATFEEWAHGMGSDPDSRKAEQSYRECLRCALALRNALGEAGLAKLREAAQDY